MTTYSDIFFLYALQMTIATIIAIAATKVAPPNTPPIKRTFRVDFVPSENLIMCTAYKFMCNIYQPDSIVVLRFSNPCIEVVGSLGEVGTRGSDVGTPVTFSGSPEGAVV